MAFLLGLFVGVIVGLVITCLCVASKEWDKED